MSEFFAKIPGVEKGAWEPHIIRFTQLRELGVALSVDSFVNAFTSIMQTFPDVPLQLAERMLAPREQELSKQFRKDALNQVKEFVEARKKAVAESKKRQQNTTTGK